MSVVFLLFPLFQVSTSTRRVGYLKRVLTTDVVGLVGQTLACVIIFLVKRGKLSNVVVTMSRDITLYDSDVTWHGSDVILNAIKTRDMRAHASHIIGVFSVWLIPEILLP